MLPKENIYFTSFNQVIIKNIYGNDTRLELHSSDGIITIASDQISESLQLKSLYKFLKSNKPKGDN